MEYIHLVGAEKVQDAANSMARTADEMKHAAGQIEYALQQHQRFMDDWLTRFEQTLEKK